MAHKRKCAEDLTASAVLLSSTSNAEGTRATSHQRSKLSPQSSTLGEEITFAEVSAAAFLYACREALVKRTPTIRSISPKYRSFLDPDNARIFALLGEHEPENERGPLHEAVVRRDAATAQVLITAGTFTQHEDEDDLTPIKLATDDQCRAVLNRHAAVLDLLGANSPDVVVATALAHCAALSNALDSVPATALSLNSYNYDPFFMWAPPPVRAAVFGWARDAYIVQLATITEPVSDLPDDCVGDILEFLEIAMLRKESMHIISHCLSSESRAWIRSIVVASIAMKANLKFISAVREGDLKTVQDCLAKGAFVDASDFGGDTALIVAAEKVHVEILKVLLHAGADLNAADTRGRTALIIAAKLWRMISSRGGLPSYEASASMMKLLIEAGADVNVMDDDGETALINFSNTRHDKTEVIELLLQAGANVNARKISWRGGSTALIEASRGGLAKFVELFLKAGAETNVMDSRGSSALTEASLNGYAAIVKLLLDAGADVHLDTDWERESTALMKASINGHIAVVKLLLESNANTNLTDDRRYTALIYASENGHSTIVRLLLKAGADKNAKNYLNSTPLIGAADNGRVAVVKRLLKAGADKEAKDYRGQTALFCASLQKKTASLALLIQFGADKEAKNKYGETALGLASRRGRSDVVALLQG